MKLTPGTVRAAAGSTSALASMPTTEPLGNQVARSAVMVPGPQPTSSSRIDGRSWAQR